MKSLMFRFLDGVEWVGNKLPHPFWLFCLLMLAVVVSSSLFAALEVSAVKPETQILRSLEDGERVDGRGFEVDTSFDGITLELDSAARSSRLNIHCPVSTSSHKLHCSSSDSSDTGNSTRCPPFRLDTHTPFPTRSSRSRWPRRS